MRFIISALATGSVALALGMFACGSEEPTSSTSPDGGASTADAGHPHDASGAAADSVEPHTCEAAEPGTGAVNPAEAYLGFCSPTCGEGQFCFTKSDISMAAMDVDAGDERPDTFETRPLLCKGCQPMTPCDGGDPCDCLRAQLPPGVCGPDAGSQCRVRDGGVQFRCLSITAL